MPSPMSLVIFLYWVGPVPYLELFRVGPVKKITLYNLFHISFTLVFTLRNYFLKVLKSNLDRRDHVMENLREEIYSSPCSFPCYSPGFASHWGGVVENSCLELLSFSHISDRNSLHISDRNSPQISDRNSARFSRKVCFLWCHTRCDSKQNPKL